MRLDFVINPRAGRTRDDGRLAAAIRAEFPDGDIRIAPPLAGSLRPGADAVVAVGGDGTVNRLLQDAASRGVPVGILPRGTSNDLAHDLGIPGDFSRACAVIREAHTAAIDLVTVNGTYFATCGGIGLPAAAAARANRWRQRGPLRRQASAMGRSLYAVAALRETRRGSRTVEAAVCTDDAVSIGCWTAVVICNQRRFGGFRVAPASSNRDGLLELCTIAGTDRLQRLVGIVTKTWRGRPQDCPELSCRPVRKARIVTERAIPFMGDGELLAYGREFHIAVAPAALRVIVPRPAVMSIQYPRGAGTERVPETRERCRA